MTAANSAVAMMVIRTPTPIPPSFCGAAGCDPGAPLFTFNLFIMTTAFFLGVMLVGRQAQRVWQQRRYDHPLDPVSLYRAITLLAGMGLTLRCGAEALNLWGWNPADPVTSARTLMAKRWLDPIAVTSGITWMGIVLLGEPGIEHQLRKAPLPVDMWSRWPTLVRAAAVTALCFVAALAAVCLR